MSEYSKLRKLLRCLMSASTASRRYTALILTYLQSWIELRTRSGERPAVYYMSNTVFSYLLSRSVVHSLNQKMSYSTRIPGLSILLPSVVLLVLAFESPTGCGRPYWCPQSDWPEDIVRSLQTCRLFRSVRPESAPECKLCMQTARISAIYLPCRDLLPTMISRY